MYSSTYVPLWKEGGPRELFMREEAFIRKFITKYKIKAVSRDMLNELAAAKAGVIIIDSIPVPAISEMTATRSAKQKIPVRIGPPPPPGGIRGPHLHFNGNVYLLNERQWGEFSQTIMKNIRERLSKAKSVSFEQLMEISEATDSLV